MPKTVHEVECSNALNKLKRKIPYGWDLNIYRGCEHGCRYCYAIYSHDYLNDSNYFDNVYVKTNIVEKLERELSSKSWQREVINIGGVTDSYQPQEAIYKIMPEVLKLLIKYKTPAIISTKSDLILRDYDLINELSHITYINVAATITTTNESVRVKIEPSGCKTAERFNVLKEFRKTNASVGVHMMPIIPFITDSFENLDSIFSQSHDAGVHYLLPGTLYFRGKIKNVFVDCIKTHFPEHYVSINLKLISRSIAKNNNFEKEYILIILNDIIK